MGEEIYQGWDCCKSYPHPQTPVRIDPEKSTVKPNAEVILTAKNIHGDCDPNCFEWKQVSGSGYLVGDFGDSNLYIAPDDNEDCLKTAVIELWCANRKIHTAYVAVNTGILGPRAYVIYSGRAVKETNRRRFSGEPWDDEEPDGHGDEIEEIRRWYASVYDCGGVEIFNFWYYAQIDFQIFLMPQNAWIKSPRQFLNHDQLYFVDGRYIPHKPWPPRTETLDLRTKKQKSEGCSIAELIEEEEP